MYNMGGSSSTSFTAEQEAPIKQQIASEPVIVFSKDYCPFCDKTKQLLKSNNISAKVVELNLEQNGDKLQGILQSISGQRTVPNIFIAGKHIGGNSELQAMAGNGELKKALDGAGISHSMA